MPKGKSKRSRNRDGKSGTDSCRSGQSSSEGRTQRLNDAGSSNVLDILSSFLCWDVDVKVLYFLHKL